MALPQLLGSGVRLWAAFCDAHRAASVTVRYLHLAGLVVGAGAAVAADWRVLKAARAGPSQRSATLAALAQVHRVVMPALAVVVTSGVLLTAADSATFLASRLYWTKMGFVALLLVNGAGLVAAESRAAAGKGWRWLGLFSGASLFLWLLILYLGVWLTVAA